MLRQYALTLFLTSIISFIGSLQLGPVNLLVIQTAVNKSLRSALWVAAGGCLPESIYSAIAVAGINSIDEKSWFIRNAGLFIVPVLLFLGIYKILKKNKTDSFEFTQDDNVVINNNLRHFGKGFALSIVNPLLLPFWISVLIYNAGLEIISIDEKINSTMFVFGAALGALLLLSSFAFLSYRKREKINKLVNGNIDKVIGYIFIVLAFIQIFVFVMEI